MVRFNKMKASTKSRSLKVVSGDESAEVKNVLVGEVWLCSGQSNMEWPVSKSADFDTEKAAANYPLIRMFVHKRVAYDQRQADCQGSWSVCSPDHVGSFSGVAYFFGRALHQELDVPIGLIGSYWGGSCIEAWSPMESLESFPAVMKVHAKLSKQKKINPREYPSNIYNGMIHPLIPYGMRGAIWYQGESNTKPFERSIFYRTLLDNMVAEWRKGWDAEFPFYAVQLVNYKKPQQQPVENTAWVAIREGILTFSKEVPNTGIAVGIDVGDAKSVHPRNKQAIGLRLAHQALAKTYQREVVAGGPIYLAMKKKGNKIFLKFDDVGSGLVEQGGAPLKTFAIAGADKKFIFATAVIMKDLVVVTSPEVPHPVAVRYAWADNPVGCNLYNKEGFPASPFRTDD